MHAMTSHCFHERILSLLSRRWGTAGHRNACANLQTPAATVQSGGACQARPYKCRSTGAPRERRGPGAGGRFAVGVLKRRAGTPASREEPPDELEARHFK
jgi:hypothetical protein